MEDLESGDAGTSRAVNYMFSVSLSPIQSDTEAETEVNESPPREEGIVDNGSDILSETPPWNSSSIDDTHDELLGSLNGITEESITEESAASEITEDKLQPEPQPEPAIKPELPALRKEVDKAPAKPKPRTNGLKGTTPKTDGTAKKNSTKSSKPKSSLNGTTKSFEKKMTTQNKTTKFSQSSHIPKPTIATRQLKLIRSASVDSPNHDAVSTQKPKIAIKTPRENKSSLVRKKQLEMTKIESKDAEGEDEDYLTPYQKKAQQVMDLEREVGHLKAMVESRDWQLSEADRAKKQDIEFLKCEKDEEIKELHDTIKAKTSERDDFKSKYETTAQKLEAANGKVLELKALFQKKEAEVQEMYLIMYKKGQQSAMFERQVQLEELAAKAPQSVSVKELLQKLEKTQGELSKWQSIQRNEAYTGGDRPDGESQATLRFLRDSMFHYLTVHGKDQAQHLKAMIAILGFTDVQMKKIQKAVTDKK